MSSIFRLAAVAFVACLAVTAANSGTQQATRPLPSDVDLRPVFDKAGFTPRSQAPRGTCSVFAFTSAVEYALAKRAPIERLSPEYANWAGARANNSRGDGNFFIGLLRGFEKSGICLDRQYPYRKRFDPDMDPPAAAREYAKWSLRQGLKFHWIKPTGDQCGLTDEQFMAFKRLLADGWPVLGGFRLSKRDGWKDNILLYYPPEGMDFNSGHSMVVVGYKDDPTQPGGGLFIILNSGDANYGYTPYAYVKSYILDCLWVDFGKPIPGLPNVEVEHP